MAIDPRLVREMLIEAARDGAAVTYKEVIERLGYDFNTNLVGQLGRVLDRIDDHARANGEPLPAVMVVRQSDRLPGQGWWVTRVKAAGYVGDWIGPEALEHVVAQQNLAIDYWKSR